MRPPRTCIKMLRAGLPLTNDEYRMLDRYFEREKQKRDKMAKIISGFFIVAFAISLVVLLTKCKVVYAQDDHFTPKTGVNLEFKTVDSKTLEHDFPISVESYSISCFRLVYEPKPDITAYELALILPFMARNSNWVGFIYSTHTDWHQLPENAKRHFKQEDITCE